MTQSTNANSPELEPHGSTNDQTPAAAPLPRPEESTPGVSPWDAQGSSQPARSAEPPYPAAPSAPSNALVPHPAPNYGGSGAPGYAGQQAPHPAGAPVLVSIGDIQVTSTHVLTPRGTFPLDRVQFTFQNNSLTQSHIPAWAIVLAILGFFFFLLGLLFLLVRETTTSGFVTVSVVGPGFTHSTQLPVSSPQQVNDIAGRVQHANNVAMSHRM